MPDAERDGDRGRPMPGRVLFVTGRLAEWSLRRVLVEIAPPFACDVAVLPITVAALMTTPWIARHLEKPESVDLVLIPGLCEGDLQAIGARFGVPVERGPKDLRDLPGYFGRAAVADDYGSWDIEIIAEINDTPRLSREALRATADRFRASGADVIDLGCPPGVPFPALGDVVRELVESGVRVSIDTFEPPAIRAAVAAGAELVLSVNGSNIDVARDLAGTGARVVVVPDLGGSLDTLEPSLEELARWGVRYVIDPILEPIGYGLMASLERYAEVRRRYPEADMLMGIGNLTELTAADSTGVNAVLVAVCQELGVRMVLTTEVAPWARDAVREVDVARRLMHYAVTRRTIPKGVDDRLVTIKDPVVLSFTEDELRELQAAVRDPNFRIFADREGITVLNSDCFVRSAGARGLLEIFAQLDVKEATHAFYLGRELERAGLAVALGKTYRQDRALSWGYLSPPEDGEAGRVSLTKGSRHTRLHVVAEPGGDVPPATGVDG